MQDGGERAEFRSVFVSAADGLRLHARDYGERFWETTPVICLPGLARTSADFHELALRLSTDPRVPRRVVACDMRGRGRSEYDATPANYDVAIEAQDILSIMAAMGVVKAAFVGASRGGLQTMVLAAMRPTVIAGGVLVDIGPVIEGKGLARIKGYVGKLPTVANIAEATALLKRLAAAQFPAWSDAQWRRMAERSFRQTPSGLLPDYDPALASTLSTIDLEAPLPHALAVLRGAGACAASRDPRREFRHPLGQRRSRRWPAGILDARPSRPRARDMCPMSARRCSPRELRPSSKNWIRRQLRDVAARG